MSSIDIFDRNLESITYAESSIPVNVRAVPVQSPMDGESSSEQSRILLQQPSEHQHIKSLFDIFGDFSSHPFPSSGDLQSFVDAYLSSNPDYIDSVDKMMQPAISLHKIHQKIAKMSKPPIVKFRLLCPNVYLRIRPQTNTIIDAVGRFQNGDVVEVYDRDVAGFYELVDGRVSKLFASTWIFFSACPLISKPNFY